MEYATTIHNADSVQDMDAGELTEYRDALTAHIERVTKALESSHRYATVHTGPGTGAWPAIVMAVPSHFAEGGRIYAPGTCARLGSVYGVTVHVTTEVHGRSWVVRGTAPEAGDLMRWSNRMADDMGASVIEVQA